VIDDILKVQREQERYYLEMLPEIDKMALALSDIDEGLMRQFLTEYGINTGNALFERWRQLHDHILTENIDGYRKKEEGPPEELGYSESWLREIVADRGEDLSIGDAAEH
jgi:hypothetical protein